MKDTHTQIVICPSQACNYKQIARCLICTMISQRPCFHLHPHKSAGTRTTCCWHSQKPLMYCICPWLQMQVLQPAAPLSCTDHALTNTAKVIAELSSKGRGKLQSFPMPILILRLSSSHSSTALSTLISQKPLWKAAFDGHGCTCHSFLRTAGVGCVTAGSGLVGAGPLDFAGASPLALASSSSTATLCFRMW